MTHILAVNQHLIPGWQILRGRQRSFYDWTVKTIGRDGIACVSEAHGCVGLSGVRFEHSGDRGMQDCGFIVTNEAWSRSAPFPLTEDDPAHRRDNGRTAKRTARPGEVVWSVHGNLIGARWDASMAALAPHVRADVASGACVTVAGDLNTDLVGEQRFRAWCAHVGLTVLTPGGTSMWIASTPNVRHVGMQRYAVGTAPGSDHTAILVDAVPTFPAPQPVKVIPVSKYAAPAPPYVGPAAHTSSGSNQPIERIVIHSTVSECKPGAARATAAYFRTAASGGSAHYVVDPGEAVQVVWDDTIAWHAPPNIHSLGVELCDMPSQDVHRWDDANHQAMLARAAELVGDLCLAYDVPATKIDASALLAGKHGICGHVDVSQAWHQTDHWDPGAFPWIKFIGLVHARIASRRTAPSKPPAPHPAPVPAYVRAAGWINDLAAGKKLPSQRPADPAVRALLNKAAAWLLNQKG